MDQDHDLPHQPPPSRPTSQDPFDWMHNAFDFDNPVIEGGPPISQSTVDLQAYYSHLSSPHVRHAPYITSQRRHRRDRPLSHPTAVEQGEEGPSQGVAFNGPSPVLRGVPPPTLVTASPAPSPAPPPAPSPLPPPAQFLAISAPSPAPAASTQTVPAVPSIFFGLSDLDEVKAESLFQMKCGLLNSSFLPKDSSDVARMAKVCITAQVSHSPELTAWSNTKDGKLEATKLCTALTTLRKNIKFLARSAALWGYNLHQLMHTESKLMVKNFVKRLIKDNSYLRGTVNGENVDIPFANVALLYFIRQLLFHDRQYKQFIGEKQNLQPLFTYTSVLFKWALTEMSTGVFQDIDFKLNEATTEHTAMENLFKTLTHEQIVALTASVYN
ncbi:hypothetical protein C8R48DRAFT_780701 [Suillus tomentosus]|nr:hypothetical protein C8R48DRAFT_780701 [Suillus tomentosus]